MGNVRLGWAAPAAIDVESLPIRSFTHQSCSSTQFFWVFYFFFPLFFSFLFLFFIFFSSRPGRTHARYVRRNENRSVTLTKNDGSRRGPCYMGIRDVRIRNGSRLLPPSMHQWIYMREFFSLFISSSSSYSSSTLLHFLVHTRVFSILLRLFLLFIVPDKRHRLKAVRYQKAWHFFLANAQNLWNFQHDGSKFPNSRCETFLG